MNRKKHIAAMIALLSILLAGLAFAATPYEGTITIAAGGSIGTTGAIPVFYDQGQKITNMTVTSDTATTPSGTYTLFIGAPSEAATVSATTRYYWTPNTNITYNTTTHILDGATESVGISSFRYQQSQIWVKLASTTTSGCTIYVNAIIEPCVGAK